MGFSYTTKYNSPNLRGIDDSKFPRPWDLNKEILTYAGRNIKLLDIGCGTGIKLVPLATHFSEITALDISYEMVVFARNILKQNNITNVSLINCDSATLPFKDNTYDIVTCMLSRWNIEEIVRVLKPHGSLIIEHIGCEDKKDFKLIFGKDELGWRGQFIEYQKEEYLNSFYTMLNKHFDFVLIKNGFWRTYYNEQGILEILKFTPTIRNFQLNADANLFQKACALFRNPQGIGLTQNRLLIHAKNIKSF